MGPTARSGGLPVADRHRTRSQVVALNRAKGEALASEVARTQATAWLFERGPGYLEELLRAILHTSRRSVPNEDSAMAAQDYACVLLDTEGYIVRWHSGASRIYGYTEDEVIGKQVCVLSRGQKSCAEARRELSRAAAQGHFANEGWHSKKDGSRFWANVITVELRDEAGELRGFARIARNFSKRQEHDEKLRRDRARSRSAPSGSTIAGIASGEFDRVPEANDAFLNLLGYSQEDLLTGALHWTDLTPPEYSALDDLAHEECLQFGACTPYEKELFRKDETGVPVLISTAVLKLTPFRWITFVQIVGVSAALRRVLRHVEVVAPIDANVLILGETGTGKELVARAVHRLSPRRNYPLITLNCAAIPTGLLESELFGYEKGAFTGALSQKMGRFELANRGALFLDEVGDIPLDLQPKLLRALQERAFERLGGTRTIPIDVRLLAATNRNLTQMMGDKLFRSDLYYRLKVFPITIPPLRDHPEDIPILARHLIQKYARLMKKQIENNPACSMRA
jgi:PAS domain S-box-containing protein